MTELNVRRYDGMAALPPSYAQLFADAAHDSLFLSSVWLRNFERHVAGASGSARIYGVEDAAAAPGAAPVAALVTRLRRGERMLAPVRLESLVNYYTPCFGIAATAAADRPAATQALARGLWADRAAWDVIDLQPLADPDSESTRVLIDALRAGGMIVQTYFCFGNWWLDVAGRSFDQYLGSLSSVLRKNIPYASRRLERTPRSRVEILTDRAAIERALPDYEKVYQSSWKIPEPHPGFIRALALDAAEAGWTRLGLVYVDDEPAAAQLWFVLHGTASIFKIAYDERFAKLSVGTVLTARLMQHVIDVDRVQCVDYLSGDDEYKKNWMSHRRERWGVLAFNPRSVRGLLQAGWRVGGRRARALLQRLRPQSHVAS